MGFLAPKGALGAVSGFGGNGVGAAQNLVSGMLGKRGGAGGVCPTCGGTGRAPSGAQDGSGLKPPSAPIESMLGGVGDFRKLF